MSRILAFDVGLKRIGIATTDPEQRIATALQTVSPAELSGFMALFTSQNQVEAIVLGKPLQADGSPSQSMTLVTQVAQWLNQHYPKIPLHYIDERYTSSIASRSLAQSGLKKKDRRKKGLLDQTSATLILQTFLETRRNGFI